MKRLGLAAALVAATILLAAAVPGAQAADTLDEVKARGKLIAGVKADFPPFGYVDEKGQLVGFDIDLAREFARALFGDPDKVELVPVTSANRIPTLTSGKIDIILASMTILPERAEVIDFSQPYFLSGHVMLVPKNSTLTKIQDLNGKTAITIQGSTGDKYTRELAPDARRLTYQKTSEALLALKDGRGDALVHDDILLFTIEKQEPTLKVVGLPPVKEAPYGLGVRKGNPKWLAFVNEQLAKMKKDGTYDALFQRWFGDVASKLLKPAA